MTNEKPERISVILKLKYKTGGANTGLFYFNQNHLKHLVDSGIYKKVAQDWIILKRKT